jgi:hypothetical protein
MNTFQKSDSLIQKKRERTGSVISDETLNAPGTRSEEFGNYGGFQATLYQSKNVF